MVPPGDTKAIGRFLPHCSRQTQQFGVCCKRIGPCRKYHVQGRNGSLLGVLRIRGLCGHVLSSAGYAARLSDLERASSDGERQQLDFLLTAFLIHFLVVFAIPGAPQRLRCGGFADGRILRSLCSALRQLADAGILFADDGSDHRWPC